MVKITGVVFLLFALLCLAKANQISGPLLIKQLSSDFHDISTKYQKMLEQVELTKSEINNAQIKTLKSLTGYESVIQNVNSQLNVKVSDEFYETKMAECAEKKTSPEIIRVKKFKTCVNKFDITGRLREINNVYRNFALIFKSKQKDIENCKMDRCSKSDLESLHELTTLHILATNDRLEELQQKFNKEKQNMERCLQSVYLEADYTLATVDVENCLLDKVRTQYPPCIIDFKC